MKQRDPTDLRGQERHREDAELARKVDRDQEKADFAWLMSDRRGRRFIWNLLDRTGMYRNPFTGNSETFFRCGAMNVGKQLMADILEFTPEQYLTMLEERKKK